MSKMTPLINISRSELFEKRAPVLSYSEMGRDIVKELVGVGLQDVETLAYRLADDEPPISGADREEYIRGVSAEVKLHLERTA